MIVVLVHLVVALAFGRAHSVLRDSGQDDMDQLDVKRTHQEAQQCAVHVATALFVALSVHLSEELPDEPTNSGLEDRLPHPHDGHDDASGDGRQVVRVEPPGQLVLEALRSRQIRIGHRLASDCRAVQDEVCKSEIWQPR